MASPFLSIHFSSFEQGPPAAFRAPRPAAQAGETFENDEVAARYYLDSVLREDRRAAVRGLTAPESPRLVPDLRVRGVKYESFTKTRLVSFEQVHSSVPVFGSNIVVELDANRNLVTVQADLADLDQASSVASVAPESALERIAEVTGRTASDLHPTAPQLVFFRRESQQPWRLAWYFRKVPAAPRASASEPAASRGHGLGPSPRDLSPLFDYLIDAGNRELLFSFSATPQADPIARCSGTDELGQSQDFFGVRVAAEGPFELTDPLRALRTFDLVGGDLETAPFPPHPLRSASAHFVNRAAVSAHVNAMKVSQFYRAILGRSSIDDKGMDLVSVVNCSYRGLREWRNAVWYRDRMWYGSASDGNGGFQSFSRYLDIIAHEVTHGVTEHTADLVGHGETGALNESLSDIFGILILNWDATDPEKDVSGWHWEIGSGLGHGGGPLRDLRDPGLTGDPSHMKDFVHTDGDSGGVHANSNIHNHAAYKVLNARSEAGFEFKPLDVAVLYYLGLQRLSRLATFKQMLTVLADVAGSFYAIRTAERDQKVAALRLAYAEVGIHG